VSERAKPILGVVKMPDRYKLVHHDLITQVVDDKIGFTIGSFIFEHDALLFIATKNKADAKNLEDNRASQC
jgi:hypothetical protein